MSLDTWCTKHAKAWLELEAGVDSSVLHHLIPRLAWVLFGRNRVYIGHLASQAAADHVKVKAMFTLSDLQSLPSIFDPRYTTTNDNVWSEAINLDLVLSGMSETVVQLVHARHGSNLLVTYQHRHHVSEFGGFGTTQTLRGTTATNSEMGFVSMAEYSQASVCSPQMPALVSSVFFSSH
ncbi:hypothetical protein HG531_000296 [Fusarium graminearum]|nr:hypothetical protein HG531_000296 [Fusarium graminearum]